MKTKGRFVKLLLVGFLGGVVPLTVAGETSAPPVKEKAEKDVPVAVRQLRRIQITEIHLMVGLSADQAVRKFSTKEKIDGQSIQLYAHFAKTPKEVSDVSLILKSSQSYIRYKLVPGSQLSKQIAESLWRASATPDSDVGFLKKLLRGSYSCKNPPL